jgi:hypothetical protein
MGMGNVARWSSALLLAMTATARKARIVILLSDMQERTHLHRDLCLTSSLSLSSSFLFLLLSTSLTP